VRIDRPDDADGRPDAAEHRADAGEAGRGEPDIEPDAAKRIARAVQNRAKVDAAVRAYAIDQGYERVSEIEKGTVTPAMRRIEAADPGRHLAGLENRLKGQGPAGREGRVRRDQEGSYGRAGIRQREGRDQVHPLLFG